MATATNSSRESLAAECPSKPSGNHTDRRGISGKVGVTPAIRDCILRATSLLANGRSRFEVAKVLKTRPKSIDDWQFTHKGLWDACYDAAMQTARETVRQLAGTPGMLQDIDAYMLTASRAIEWSHERGEQLFDRGEALTLPQFYERRYLPMRPHAQPTQNLHRIILRRWAAITSDPPLADITADHLIMFRDTLSKMRGLKGVGYLSPNTVAGYMSKIQAFIDKAGPAGWRNRDALGLIDKAPWAKPPRGIRRAVRTVSEETMNRFYDGCIAASRPCSPHFKPAAWWRALVVLLYNTGIRRGTAFRLRMRWVNWQKRCIVIPPEVTKTGQEQIIPMNEVVFNHLQAIYGDREYLFDFGRRIDRYFYTVLHRLQSKCGIAPENHFNLHQLRKTCATVLWEHNPQAAQFALGHTTLGTTAGYYVRGQGMLARAAEQMPQPAAFCNGHASERATTNGRKDGGP